MHFTSSWYPLRYSLQARKCFLFNPDIKVSRSIALTFLDKDKIIYLLLLQLGPFLAIMRTPGRPKNIQDPALYNGHFKTGSSARQRRGWHSVLCRQDNFCIPTAAKLLRKRLSQEKLRARQPAVRDQSESVATRVVAPDIKGVTGAPESGDVWIQEFHTKGALGID